MHSYCAFVNHSKEVNSCVFSKDYFVTASGDKSIRIYSSTSFHEVPYSPLTSFKYGINCVTIGLDESLLAAAVSDGKVYLFRLRPTESILIATFQHSVETPAQACSLTNNSMLLMSGSSDGSIALLDIQSKKLIRKICGHPGGNVNAVAFTPCDFYAFTGSSAGDMRVWDLATFQVIVQTQAHDEGLSSCGVSSIKIASFCHDTVANPNRSYLVASCGHDNKVKLWFFDVVSKHLTSYRQLTGHTGPVNSCAFIRGGISLASGSYDKRVIIWNILTGEQELELLAHDRIITCVAASSDGLLASSSFDKTTIIWKSGPRLTELKYVGNKSMPSDQQQILSTNQVSSSSPHRSALQGSVIQWSCDDVASWLSDNLGLGQYSDAFKRNAVDGVELVLLTSDALVKDIGVAPLGHRNKILRAIHKLKSST